MNYPSKLGAKLRSVLETEAILIRAPVRAIFALKDVLPWVGKKTHTHKKNEKKCFGLYFFIKQTPGGGC